MSNRFIAELFNFANAAYPVDADSINRVWGHVRAFLEEIAEVDYYEVMRTSTAHNGQHLMTLVVDSMYWSSNTNSIDRTPIREDDGRYFDQVTFAFAENVPLWVQDKNGGALRTDGDFVNLWPGVKAKRLPRYYRWPDWKETKTQIVLPMFAASMPTGVLILETVKLYPYTQGAADAFKSIADALAKILASYDGSNCSLNGTKEVLSSLAAAYQIAKKSDKDHPFAKPTLFLASSNRAEQDVIAAIQETVDGFTERIKLEFWQEWSQSGEIHEKIMREVARANYGICYFSEPNPESTVATSKYIDNPNVLFEAGMLHALSKSDQQLGSAPSDWLAIREVNSPKIPFDFGNRNILFVPRFNSGELNRRLFCAELQKRIGVMLGKRTASE